MSSANRRRLITGLPLRSRQESAPPSRGSPCYHARPLFWRNANASRCTAARERKHEVRRREESVGNAQTVEPCYARVRGTPRTPQKA